MQVATNFFFLFLVIFYKHLSYKQAKEIIKK